MGSEAQHCGVEWECVWGGVEEAVKAEGKGQPEQGIMSGNLKGRKGCSFRPGLLRLDGPTRPCKPCIASVSATMQRPTKWVRGGLNTVVHVGLYTWRSHV